MVVPGAITPARGRRTCPLQPWDQWPRKGLNGRGWGDLENSGRWCSPRKGRRRISKGREREWAD